MKEQLIKIIENEENIIPFLKELTDDDKRNLVPTLKKLHKKLFNGSYQNIEKNTYGFVYDVKSDKQRKLINLACFVCFNKTDALKILPAGNLCVDDFYLKNIIPWYVPKWFSDAINEDEPNITYLKLMDLYKKGLLNPNRSYLVSRLVNACYTWDRTTRSYIDTSDSLEKHKETLEEHIWYLFKEQSEINWTGRWNGNVGWLPIFKNLYESGKIDRTKLLKATINTSTKGFNKTLSGWFIELLLMLNPTEEELLNLQDDLFSALSSPHSKIVNTVLKYFKTLAIHKNFKSNLFIENASILLNSETKSVVNSTLMIFDKIAKSHKDLQQEIALKSCEALLNTDEKIQERASKIILKYAKNKSELSDEISMYADNLYTSSKGILADFIDEITEIEDDFEIQKTLLLNDENRIETYESLDDLIFFVSQAIDNNEVYHIDLLLSYLPKLNLLIDKENVTKLEPILKRAFDYSLKTDWSKKIGQLEVKVSELINDFGKILVAKFPDELENYIKFKNKSIENLKQNEWLLKYKKHIAQKTPIEEQSIPLNYTRVHHFLFLKTKDFLNKNIDLQLLSMPTHSPCWISPKVLIECINTYEKAKIEIDIYDFQIAIGRLPVGEIPADISENIETISNEEIKNVFRYHFGLKPLKKEKIKTPELWLQSVLVRNNSEEIQLFESLLDVSLKKERGLYDFHTTQTKRTYKDWVGEKDYIDKELLLKVTYENPVDATKNAKIKSIYNHYIFLKKRWNMEIYANDDIKYFLLSPNNPSPFLSQVIFRNLGTSTLWEVDEKVTIGNLIKILYEVWNNQKFNEMTYLFLASIFLCDNKTAREFSAELWIKGIAQNTINNKLLGEILGKLEHQEYGALKRFTDLIISNMFNISKKHNEKLMLLLDAMLSQMNDTPIRGLKKLLELFYEVKQPFFDYKISEQTIDKLNVWSETKSLKSLVGKILKV